MAAEYNPKCPNCGYPYDESKIFLTRHNRIESENFITYQCYCCNHEWAIKKKEKNQMYIIVRDIKDNRDISCPNKVFDTEYQAQVVAEKMTAEHQRVFYVAKLIIRTKPVQNSISERVDA